MADTQRRRSRNFTEFEKELLLDIVMKYIHIIENKKTDAKTIQDKNECWRRVTEEFNAKSFNGARMYAQLRMLYDNLKKNARKDNTGEKVKSKAVEKLITMLTVPYDVLPTSQIDNTIYNNPKFDGSEFSIEDTDHNKEVVLNAMPIRDSNSAQQALISSFKSEKVNGEPNCSDDQSLDAYESPLLSCNEMSAQKGYKRRLNHILEEIHNFVKKKSDDSHLKKKLYNIRAEQAEVELQIKKVELEIKIKELEICKKELELKSKELELKNKELGKFSD